MLPTNDQNPIPNYPIVAGLEILEIVARGGHGTVYRARQQEHDRIVALKVLDARFVDDATRRRFDRERVALGRISDHPSIVSLLDSGYTEAGAPYLLLQFASGGSLEERLAGGPLGLDEATAIIVCLAAAIERTHNAGVVHRDIKPANIMRSAYDDWMLTDFGIASIVDRSATGVVHASYAHTAPETFGGSDPAPVADVYSLASVLATCLTGEEPFAMTEGEAPVSVMRRVATEPYPNLRAAGVPENLAALLEMALSKEPAHRPVSARAFAAALNDIRREHGLMAVAIRTGEESAPDSTTLVNESDAVAAGGPSWSTGGKTLSPAIAKDRKGAKVLAGVAMFLFAIFGLSFFTPIADSINPIGQALAAVVDDGPGNGNGRGNGGGGNGGDGDGAAQLAAQADNDGADNDGADNDGADNDGADNDGNGPGGNGNDGPGRNGRGNGGNGNGPGGNGGNGGGNGGGGNGPGGN